MTDHSMHQHGGHEPVLLNQSGPTDVWLRRARWVFWAFVAIAAAYLVAEHRSHLAGALPFLIILACPLLHMFMHGGHGGHGHHGGHGGGDPRRERETGRGGSGNWEGS